MINAHHQSHVSQESLQVQRHKWLQPGQGFNPKARKMRPDAMGGWDEVPIPHKTRTKHERAQRKLKGIRGYR